MGVSQFLNGDADMRVGFVGFVIVVVAVVSIFVIVLVAFSLIFAGGGLIAQHQIVMAWCCWRCFIPRVWCLWD